MMIDKETALMIAARLACGKEVIERSEDAYLKMASELMSDAWKCMMLYAKYKAPGKSK